MSLNPLALLEKAINEHGSSAILKERLELVRDQLAKVEREKHVLETELAVARTALEEAVKQLPVPSSSHIEGSSSGESHPAAMKTPPIAPAVNWEWRPPLRVTCRSSVANAMR